MDKNSSQDSINPAKLRIAIENHFRNHSAEEIVARIEQLRPVASDDEDRSSSLAVKAAEISWLFMVCTDGTERMKAILLASRLVEQLGFVSESVESTMGEPDVPTIISVQHKRMLVSQPRYVAGVLKGIVNSHRFREMVLSLEKWATVPAYVPSKTELVEASTIFASLAPILEESSL